ncbi:MAG: Bor family protein [Flavobacteriales bacterium]|nr:Bor family protein [Flavobacteriales bacterium]
MKRLIYNLILVVGLSIGLTSCFTLTYSVGKGGTSGTTVKEKNHYLIYGLAPLKTSNPTQMAGGAEDYTVTIKHTFVDGLIQSITLGIYTPTTTFVTK